MLSNNCIFCLLFKRVYRLMYTYLHILMYMLKAFEILNTIVLIESNSLNVAKIQMAQSIN